jgi:hypothetical protein
VWARLHKLDRVKPQPTGGAVILIEDSRPAAQMQRVPSLSSLIAIARVLAALRALEAKYDGKGAVHYDVSTAVPSFLSEAITRAGATITSGDRVVVQAAPAGVAAMIDVAFSELAHHVRGSIGVLDLAAALAQTEKTRRASPLDKDQVPEKYWPAVLELAALAGELARKRGGRWVETRDLPVPFALKFPDGALAHPTQVAQKIVEGADDKLETS